MALSSCFGHPHGSKAAMVLAYRTPSYNSLIANSALSRRRVCSRTSSQHAGANGVKLSSCRSFSGEPRFTLQHKFSRKVLHKRNTGVFALWIPPSQIASSVFTLGTAAVLPLYTLMVVAPRAELTRRSMESSIPYIVLGLLYAYLLYLSWMPDTLRYMFANKYWMPELLGIAKMFTNEMTVASAWIHLLAIDLFAARQIYHDGLENNVETRHSVSLCLLFCPIGVVTHFITKALSRSYERNNKKIH